MSSRLLVLDTNAYSSLKRGQKELSQLVRSAESLALPCVVVGELMGGFGGGNRFAENVRLLQRFLAQPSCSLLEISRPTTSIYGELYTFLKQRGKLVPTNDIWIAALTIEYEGQLATYDQDFADIPGLELAF